MIKPGEEWGGPAVSPPDIDVEGDDAALARAVAGAPGALIRFRPTAGSDLARAVGIPAGGIAPAEVAGSAVPLDALALADGTLAANMCVFGTPPDRLRWWSPARRLEIRLDGRPWFEGRATTVVVAIGQFLRGLDIVPRGHPGDGKAEIQVYGLERRERRLMRARLATGDHVPHPRIRQRSGHTIDLRAQGSMTAEVDGMPHSGLPAHTRIEVVPGAYELLI